MDPLQTDIPNVAALTNEPTVSRTNLRLEFGEVVGNVKTLNRAAGSTFSVSTPAGAAGIRGTTFRIVYRPTGDGQAFNYTLSTSEGVVLFEGTTPDGTAAAVNVPRRQEIVLVATINPATNSIVVSMPALLGGGGNLVVIPISAAAIAALQTTTLQIIQVQQQTSFTQVDFQTARQQQQQQQQNQPPGQGQQLNQGQASPPGQAGTQNPNLTNPFQQNQAQPPPLPPSSVPRTTPGDGR